MSVFVCTCTCVYMYVCVCVCVCVCPVCVLCMECTLNEYMEVIRHVVPWPELFHGVVT